MVAQAPPTIEYYRLVPGFLPEVFTDDGMAKGTGFAAENPWGAYTAYLLATNAKGQRTWRIEDYLPNAGGATSQGSTMYLFEGNERALLVDTAQNTADVPGKTDLKTVVRHLLALDPLFHGDRAKALWLEAARRNLAAELAGLT